MKNKTETTAEKSNDELAEEFSDIKRISERLSSLVEIIVQNIYEAETFSIIFRHLFWTDPPSYKLGEGSYGATRSGWTYHTAIAMAQASKTLGLDCKFEASGRRDAVIETRHDKPIILLFAEWEWDYLDVFGKGKELDKLLKSCKESKTAHAFLLTYCPQKEYVDYIQKVAESWISATKKQKLPPSLFLHVVTFEDDARTRNFTALKTAEINVSNLILWNELFF